MAGCWREVWRGVARRDRGRLGEECCLREEVAHARRADADKHLDKLGARGGNEGDARLIPYLQSLESNVGSIPWR